MVTYEGYRSSSSLVSVWRKQSRLCGFGGDPVDSRTSQHQQDVEPSSWGVAGQGQQASAHEVTSPLFITAMSSAAGLGKLGDEFVVTSGPGLETDACMTFPPCWYFMIKLKWSPEVHTGDFPLKATNLFSERFFLCLWNHQYAGAYLQHQVKLALNHNSYQDYQYFCIMCMFFVFRRKMMQ